MSQELCDYVFSEKERTVFFSALVLLLFVLVTMGILTVCFAVLSYLTFGILAGIIAMCAICLLVEHIRNREIRNASFSLSPENVALQYGNTQISFTSDDEYCVSILRLYQALGKGYTYKQYLILWSGSAPSEEVHPYILIKKGCIVLPLTADTLVHINQFAHCLDIPRYPEILYHSQSGVISTVSMIQQ